jgi:phospholipase C
MAIFEKYYGKFFRIVLWLINPFKKAVIRTEAKVHKFINEQALEIIKKHNFSKEYELLKSYIEQLNKGVVWADVDFKCIDHFYNPVKEKGLYGHSNALILAQNYYDKAIKEWINNDISRAMFYLGACIHIIQDLTVPQHVNIKLLDNHVQYENYVKLTYNIKDEFITFDKPIVFKELKDYILFNTKTSLRTYRQFKKIDNKIQRYYRITKCILPLAQRTTAGCLLMFLKDIGFIKKVKV